MKKENLSFDTKAHTSQFFIKILNKIKIIKILIF